MSRLAEIQARHVERVRKAYIDANLSGCPEAKKRASEIANDSIRRLSLLDIPPDHRRKLDLIAAWGMMPRVSRSDIYELVEQGRKPSDSSSSMLARFL
jgi:hypothetical protein